ncbi:hypothetical protein GQS52_25330 [Streptomyces sp. SCUT-3]|uniref:DUF5947 family protein n=1 Tax=Streptomyces sp. SCUT-3 TaxID=2684469 RepID=UPI0015FBECF0|nr:DUF5947 family protein [Streptomyces sp. SCUT-3]QMV24544.1 hypothetical protein GQS52_25330 [Streptomyces sp. SCUT-3]
MTGASRTASDRPAAAPRGLRRFTGPRPPRQERCELCTAPLADGGHRHLVDTANRALACTCTPCALLFDRPGAAGGRFRTVPERYLADPDHGLDDSTWEALGIPVGVAFLFRNSALDRTVALCPSPAGATESEPSPSAWRDVLRATRLAGTMEPDVEALLLRRTDGRTECYLAPVDVCYELVGLMRLHWRGFDGGQQARAGLESVFDRVRARARHVRKERMP